VCLLFDYSAIFEIYTLSLHDALPIFMGQLSLPLLLLALGTLARSVCFEFRLRAPTEQQGWWQLGFALGSVSTAFAHGVLLAQVRSEEHTSELQSREKSRMPSSA